MQPKRIITTLLVVILALLTAGIPISAEGGTTLDMAVEVSSSTALSDNALFVVDEGDIVTVSVTIKSNPGFTMANFTMVYDATRLEPVMENGSLSWTRGVIFSENAEQKAVLKNNTIKYTVNDPGDDFKGTGRIFSCKFRVKAHGTASVLVEMDAADAINSTLNAAFSAVNIVYGNDPFANALLIQAHSFGAQPQHVPATCTESGKNIYSCTVCDETASVSLLAEPAKGHTETAIPSVAPTCRVDGLTAGVVCSTCDTVLQPQLKIPAGDAHHSVQKLPGKAPTCTETGLTEGEHCTICETVLKSQTELPMQEHSYGEWVEDVAPTENEAGSRSKTCTVCGHKVTETVPSLNEAAGLSFLEIVLIVISSVFFVVIVGAVVLIILDRKRSSAK